MRFARRRVHHTGHVPLRNPCAPRCQGEPMQIEPSQRRRDDNDGDDGHGGDDGGDDGDGGGGDDDGDQCIHGVQQAALAILPGRRTSRRTTGQI